MRSWNFLALLACLLLSGCSSLEYQSDLPDKKPLPVLETSLKIVKKWTVSSGSGTGKNDIKLLLASHNGELLTADYTGDVVAINAANGVTKWKLNLDVPVSSGPSIAEDKMVVGTNNGRVLAIDLNTHKLAWNSATTSEVLAPPAVGHGMVFAHTMDGSLSALSLADGRQLWRFTHTLPPLVLRRGAKPIVTAEAVIAGFSNGKLIALHTQDGAVQWSQDVGHPKGRTDLQRMVDISADPLLSNGVIYAASYQGNLAALEQSNGHIVWQRDISSYSGSAQDGKLLYVATTDGDVCALDLKTGATLWTQPALQGRILSKPAVMGKHLVLGDRDGFVHWLDLSKGTLVGRFQLDKDGVEATPVIHNNIVYILGRSGKLVALEVN